MRESKLTLKSMETWIIHVVEQIRASAWTLPATCVVCSILLSQLTLFLDTLFGESMFDKTAYLKIWTVASAQSLLSTIASSSLALAGTAFSSIMVTMTLATQQFGPRLLRNFMKDRSSQFCLGWLMGTFVYSLFIIRGPRSRQDGDFVPQLSTIVAMAMAIASLFFFIHFIQHVLTTIQEENVISDAYKGLESTINNIFPEMDAGEEERIPAPPEDEGWPVEAGKSGYIQAIDSEGLLRIARQNDVVLWIVCRPGWFITARRTAVRVIQGGEASLDADKKFINAIQKCIYVGSNRTSEQDFEYGIRQLVEVCLRALSPGVNDPFTAMDCLDYLGAGLEAVFARPLPGPVLRDSDENIRVLKSVTEYNGLLCAAVDQIRQASRTDCAVSCHLLGMLKNLAKTSNRRDQQQVVLDQATMIKHDTVPAMFNDHDREAINSRYQQVFDACYLCPLAEKS